MNLFQGFLDPQTMQSRQNRSNQPAGSPIKPRMIRLTSVQQEEDLQSDSFDPQLILRAMNNSFTKRMSNHDEKAQFMDIFSLIGQFGLKLHHRQSIEQIDISIQRWCIVALDEKKLQKTGIGNFGSPINSILSFCGNSESDKSHQIQMQQQNELPHSLKLYSLVMNMNSKQLVFQSQEEPTNRFYINLDTVRVHIKNVSNANYYSPLILSIHQKQYPLELHLYMTKDILPFPFSISATQQQKIAYLNKNKTSLFQLLDKSILQSRGYQFTLRKAIQNSLQNQTIFYSDRFATEQQFARYCETGDIILFKDSHTMAKVQRTLTNSPYDHVGIVYKSQNLGICLFESNSGTGVGMASWRQLIRFHWFEGIEKIVWRKLQLHKKQQNFQQKVTQFIKANLHKEFGLSLPKLLRFQSVAYSHDDKRSFFCSELVATLYKYMGILEPKKSSTQYWPKDFADGNGLQILGGALDPQRQLIFEDRILKESYRFYEQKK